MKMREARARLIDGKVIVSDAIQKRRIGALEETAFLIERGKMRVYDERGDELRYEDFIGIVARAQPDFMRRYLVYRDLRERGYAVRCGPDFLWLLPRGGENAARSCVYVFSENDSISIGELRRIAEMCRNIRKEAMIAVVDDESNVTYYGIHEKKFAKSTAESTARSTAGSTATAGPSTAEEATDRACEIANADSGMRIECLLLGDRVLISDDEMAKDLHKNLFGTFIGDNLHLSLVEAAYLLKKGVISISIKERNVEQQVDNAKSEFNQFMKYASGIINDFALIYAVYEDMRNIGLIPKTGFKFGSHFRVYERESDEHSSFLVSVASASRTFSMYEISRAVRLAHGVRKQMIFALSDDCSVYGENACEPSYICVVRKRL